MITNKLCTCYEEKHGIAKCSGLVTDTCSCCKFFKTEEDVKEENKRNIKRWKELGIYNIIKSKY